MHGIMHGIMQTGGVRLLLQGLCVLVAALVARILYRGYTERARVRSLKAQGIVCLSLSMVLIVRFVGFADRFKSLYSLIPYCGAISLSLPTFVRPIRQM